MKTDGGGNRRSSQNGMCKKCNIGGTEYLYVSSGEVYPDTGRAMLRPCVSLPRTLLFCLGYELTALGAALLLSLCFGLTAENGLPRAWCVLAINGGLLAVSVAVFAKRVVIRCVLLYQRYASYSVRARCVFTPSCSEYMLLSIEKYGFFKGFGKGVGRLGRCEPSRGGEDWP